MKTSISKHCWAAAKVSILGTFVPLLLLFAGCDSAGEFAKAGAGTTVGIMGAGMATELARDLLLKGIEGVDNHVPRWPRDYDRNHNIQKR